MNHLKGKIVCITGASAGIGEACAEAFAAAGANLILLARSIDKLEALKERLSTDHPDMQIYTAKLDVRDRTAVEKLIGDLPEEFKTIDVLVNNAGLGLGRDAFHKCHPDDWDVMIDTNVKGLLYVSHAVVQGMAARKSGMVINIGSLAGREPYPCGNVYCATKAAVNAISDTMRIDLVDEHVRVCTIQPGKVRTDFSLVRNKGDQEKHEQTYEGYTPLEAEDVADAIVYAASRPPHVQIAELYILPTDMASARDFCKKK